MSDIASATPTATPENKAKKTRVGLVVSNKMNKTIVVEVERRVAHPLFKKIVRKTSKFYAHDEEQKAAIGDTVVIEESRPLSKLKRWSLVAVQRH